MIGSAARESQEEQEHLDRDGTENLAPTQTEPDQTQHSSQQSLKPCTITSSSTGAAASHQPPPPHQQQHGTRISLLRQAKQHPTAARAAATRWSLAGDRFPATPDPFPPSASEEVRASEVHSLAVLSSCFPKLYFVTELYTKRGWIGGRI
ncbi:uncharacterized protein LOC100835172 isoform X2 [Brachypodium distachyon]|uniref:uncharacterized protein LOC100835172 isoform X2 n=1 Tax=Brachypodium distachyon TaxID=15368 RepID=UPI000D0CE797|nr:uncharacterized protein LOC100835172 isoform X2 [Brachypodium distachyon]|eukprot:XP_024311598.1 uncharacterized protein LOC100835172 isoform X2 [Brachypodium distachyon]